MGRNGDGGNLISRRCTILYQKINSKNKLCSPHRVHVCKNVMIHDTGFVWCVAASLRYGCFLPMEKRFQFICGNWWIPWYTVYGGVYIIISRLPHDWHGTRHTIISKNTNWNRYDGRRRERCLRLYIWVHFVHTGELIWGLIYRSLLNELNIIFVASAKKKNETWFQVHDCTQHRLAGDGLGGRGASGILLSNLWMFHRRSISWETSTWLLRRKVWRNEHNRVTATSNWVQQHCARHACVDAN